MAEWKMFYKMASLSLVMVSVLTYMGVLAHRDILKEELVLAGLIGEERALTRMIKTMPEYVAWLENNGRCSAQTKG